jgi:hypothetical protein
MKKPTEGAGGDSTPGQETAAQIAPAMVSALTCMPRCKRCCRTS